MNKHLEKKFGDFQVLKNSDHQTSNVEGFEISSNYNWINLSIKRIIDLSGAFLFFLICGFWLFPLVGLLIKLDSKGPIFFKQPRVGINGRIFNCYKFRTMYLNDEANKLQAIKNDPRVTKIGRVLRKISMDELPQFMNVIYGNMSLIGPRPLIPIQYDFLRNKIEGFENRTFVKPGVSGLAQAKGYRGETQNFYSSYFRQKLDIYYIKNWYPLLDLKLIWMTIHSIVFGDNKAY